MCIRLLKKNYPYWGIYFHKARTPHSWINSLIQYRWSTANNILLIILVRPYPTWVSKGIAEHVLAGKRMHALRLLVEKTALFLEPLGTTLVRVCLSGRRNYEKIKKITRSYKKTPVVCCGIDFYFEARGAQYMNRTSVTLQVVLSVYAAPLVDFEGTSYLLYWIAGDSSQFITNRTPRKLLDSEKRGSCSVLAQIYQITMPTALSNET